MLLGQKFGNKLYLSNQVVLPYDQKVKTKIKYLEKEKSLLRLYSKYFPSF